MESDAAIKAFITDPEIHVANRQAYRAEVFPKFNSGISWELLRESIWHLLMIHRSAEFGCQLDLFRTIVLQFDEEQFLKAFELVEDG